MTTTFPVNTSFPISKDDVRDLKAAVSVVYRYQGGKSYIQVNNKKDGMTLIPCNTVMSSYGKGLGDIRIADYSESHLEYSHTYRTMVNCMQAGDVLTLEWTACNNNQYLDKAELYADVLHLRVERMKNGNKKRFDFYVTTQICANNTAKMIRHTSTPKALWERG